MGSHPFFEWCVRRAHRLEKFVNGFVVGDYDQLDRGIKDFFGIDVYRDDILFADRNNIDSVILAKIQFN